MASAKIQQTSCLAYCHPAMVTTTMTTMTITKIEKLKSMKREHCLNAVWPKRMQRNRPFERQKNVPHSKCTLKKCTNDIFSIIITAPISTDRKKCVAFIRHCRWLSILVIQIVPLCKIPTPPPPQQQLPMTKFTFVSLN